MRRSLLVVLLYPKSSSSSTAAGMNPGRVKAALLLPAAVCINCEDLRRASTGQIRGIPK
jgi:hypothetical protein